MFAKLLAFLVLITASFVANAQTITYSGDGSPTTFEKSDKKIIAFGVDAQQHGALCSVETDIVVQSYLAIPADFAAAFVSQAKGTSTITLTLKSNLDHPLTVLAYYSPLGAVPPGAQATIDPAPVDSLAGAIVCPYVMVSNGSKVTIRRSGNRLSPQFAPFVVAITAN